MAPKNNSCAHFKVEKRKQISGFRISSVDAQRDTRIMIKLPGIAAQQTSLVKLLTSKLKKSTTPKKFPQPALKPAPRPILRLTYKMGSAMKLAKRRITRAAELAIIKHEMHVRMMEEFGVAGERVLLAHDVQRELKWTLELREAKQKGEVAEPASIEVCISSSNLFEADYWG